MKSTFDLVVIGHLLKEKIIFPDGKEIGPVLGSPAAYASVCASVLGLKVGLVTKIGEDLPEELLGVFKETGVDTEGIRMDKNTTANLLIYKRSGDKRLKFLKKAEDISPEDIPKNYFNAQFFLIAPVDYEVSESVIRFLHQKGSRLSMELSGFGGASSREDGKSTKEERINLIRRVTPYFEIVKGGEEDYRCLFGDSEEVDTAYKFIEWGAKISVLTRGEKGAIVIRGEDFFKIPSFPGEICDPTGAGDVWHAGFLFKYLKKGSLKEAGIFASALSFLLIQKTGGIVKERFPTCRQVEKKIREKSVSEEQQPSKMGRRK